MRKRLALQDVHPVWLVHMRALAVQVVPSVKKESIVPVVLQSVRVVYRVLSMQVPVGHHARGKRSYSYCASNIFSFQ